MAWVVCCLDFSYCDEVSDCNCVHRDLPFVDVLSLSAEIALNPN